MEKMTRMSKYKELRESLKNDVVTNEQAKPYIANEEIVKDASYYRNLVGENINNESQVEIQQANNNDTLLESLTFETITENEPEEVKSAIGRVKENSGLNHYNTRMDILNKIRQSKIETPSLVVEDEEVEENEFVPNSFKLEIEEKVNESIVEETNEVEEEIEEDTNKKRFGFFKKKKVDEEVVEEEVEEEVEEIEEETEEEESSFMVKLLNGLIIVLSLVLVGLVLFIAKEFLL